MRLLQNKIQVSGGELQVSLGIHRHTEERSPGKSLRFFTENLISLGCAMVILRRFCLGRRSCGGGGGFQGPKGKWMDLRRWSMFVVLKTWDIVARTLRGVICKKGKIVYI